MVAAFEMDKLQPENEENTNLTTKFRQHWETLKSNKDEIFGFIVLFLFVILFGAFMVAIVTSEPQKSDREVILDNAKELKAIQTKMQEISVRIEELKSNNAKEMQELKSDMRAVFGKLVEVPTKENTTRIVFEVPEIKSIRKDIEGSWKLVDHMNFEGYQKAHDNSNLNFEKFSENLRFDTLPDGRLVQTGGGSEQLIEDSSKKSEFYEEGNHLKSHWSLASTADRFVQDGKLIRIDFFEGGVAKREYHKI